VRLLLATSLAWLAPLAAPAPAPQTPPVAPDDLASPLEDPVTEALHDERLARLDAVANAVTDVRANFRQQRYTPLLQRPMLSSGTVRVIGRTVRWDTDAPYNTAMLITPVLVRIYYPQSALLEEYALDDRLGEVALSPCFRPRVLAEHFTMTVDDPASDEQVLAVDLVPRGTALRQFVQRVHVVIRRATATVDRAELFAMDDERTVVTFQDARTNVGLEDSQLQLHVAPAKRIVRPLARERNSAE
jgi:hypothetical protein